MKKLPYLVQRITVRPEPAEGRIGVDRCFDFNYMNRIIYCFGLFCCFGFCSCDGDDFWTVLGVIVIISWIGAWLNRGGKSNVHIHLGGGSGGGDNSDDNSSDDSYGGDD